MSALRNPIGNMRLLLSAGGARLDTASFTRAAAYAPHDQVDLDDAGTLYDAVHDLARAAEVVVWVRGGVFSVEPFDPLQSWALDPMSIPGPL